MTIVACFPTLPPEEDEDAGVDATTIAEVTVADAEPDVTPLEDISQPLPDVEEDTSTPLEDTSTPLEDTSTPLEDTVTPLEDTVTPLEDTDTGPILNECGGTGPLVGDQPGAQCGACVDGEVVCDAADSNKNRTVCFGASALNACGSCGVLAYALGTPCDECGTGACAANGTGQSVCVAPSGGCFTPLTCIDLSCNASSRECVPNTETEDAYCDECVPGFIDNGTVCLRSTTTPSNIVATVNLAQKVVVTWDASPFATGYRIYRCDKETACSESDWSLLLNGEVARTSYDDAGTTEAPPPSAPAVSATTNKVNAITVTWSRVSNPTAASYRYRVTALAPAGETVPSVAALGSRAPRVITAYQLKIGEGEWASVGDVLSFEDEGAPAPTLNAGTATASKGVYAGYVALTVGGTAAVRGTSVTYAVRAVTSNGTTGQASNTPSGNRAAPMTWTITWERSAGASSSDFELLSGATSNTYNDSTAPEDGSVRYYRAVVNAANTAAGQTAAVAGSRLPPPGVPGNVAATTEREDAVVVTWEAVPEAIGYRVYRDGTLITTGSQIVATSYTDSGIAGPGTQWAAPTNLGASTNNTTQVTVSWTAPTRPQGPLGSYEVLAVNTAGDGPKSAAVTGRRSRPALVGYEVETTWSGSSASWTNTQALTTSWIHANAPSAEIAPGTITVTDGDHMAKVVLSSSGQAANRTLVTYRVRGVLDGGAQTPVSSSTTGSRSVGSLTRRWQYSFQPVALDMDWTDLGTTADYEHTTAPADGSKLYYRLRLTASGAPPATVGPVEGRRLAFVDVKAGFMLYTGSHYCALTNNGRVWCWGVQKIGVPTDIKGPARIEGLDDVTRITVGVVSACAIRGEGEVWCWGKGDASVPVPVRVLGINDATDVTLGLFHRCVRSAGGTVRCWGLNSSYQLGNGTTIESTTPIYVLSSMGLMLQGITSIDTGSMSYHTCSRGTDGRARCWGGGVNAVSNGALGAVIQTNEGYPVVATGVTNFVQVSADSSSSCGVTSSREAYCWGNNSNGQLGLGDTDTRLVPNIVNLGNNFAADYIEVGVSWTCALSGARTSPVSTAGQVRCWGSDIGTTPSLVPANLGTAKTLSVAERACAIVGVGVKCWGRDRVIETVSFP